MKKDLKLKIAKELISKREVTTAELVSALQVSREAIVRTLSKLEERQIISKQGRRYSLSGKVAVLILSLGKYHGEIVAFDGKQGDALRMRLQYSESKSYEQNLEYLTETLIAHAKFIKKDYVEVGTCLIHDGKRPLPLSLAGRFDLVKTRDDLIAEALCELYGGASMYLSFCRKISFLCRGGRAMSLLEDLPNNIPSAISSAFSLVRPEVLFIEGAEEEMRRDISHICEEYSIKMFPLVLDEVNRLFLDEREMVVKCIAQ